MLTRPRIDRDLDACVAILSQTRVDGYPIRWPDDPIGWLTPRGFLAAWVAEDEGAVAGHIALRSVIGMDGMAVWTVSTGLPESALVAVSRLFVDPASRGRGVGGALLAMATAHAVDTGRQAVLDVLDTDRAAVRLYERSGWKRVASADFPHAGGPPVLTHYYVGPTEPSHA
jgi:ribosomal protein S18 acetylase RimI-like enzyme